MTLVPRVVVVHRRTELEELLDRHATRGQAEFFLRSRGRGLGEVQGHHDALQQALHAVAVSVPADWRRGSVERADLSRFLFEPEDVVVVVGQDGLVANVAKYVTGQPVVGVDPEPGQGLGVLVRHRAEGLGPVLAAAASGRVRLELRTMVAAVTDEGRSLLALNEVYLGHPSHQSARYQLVLPDGVGEQQSSSGVLVSTGTGATGWCASVSNERCEPVELPAPADEALAWFVREAWPSPTTGTSFTQGLLRPGEDLLLTSRSDPLTVFGDGIETDRLLAGWGQQIRVGVAERRLALVV